MEYPILFTPEMVKAILDGRKTMTRRVIKLAHDGDVWAGNVHPDGANDGWIAWWPNGTADDTRQCYPNGGGFRCPYGQPGDLLVIRSTWAVLPEWDNHKPSDIPPDEIGIWFWLAGTREKPEGAGKSRPGRFLPKTLWHYLPRLEVTGVRVERVQDISEGDAKAEGAPRDWPGDRTSSGCYKSWFSRAWNKINAKRGYSWDPNPWVWVVGFKRVTA